mmetsp:Transcript_54724/g.129937  ORF Transcript_54724/g.129937 Transcript_54724/m.129937 type:complete len:221 (-) Transcript_54724:2703-3365(-)
MAWSSLAARTFFSPTPSSACSSRNERSSSAPTPSWTSAASSRWLSCRLRSSRNAFTSRGSCVSPLSTGVCSGSAVAPAGSWGAVSTSIPSLSVASTSVVALGSTGAAAGSSELVPAVVPTDDCGVSSAAVAAVVAAGGAAFAGATAVVPAECGGTRASAGSSASPLVPRIHTSPWFSISNSGGGLLSAGRSRGFRRFEMMRSSAWLCFSGSSGRPSTHSW